MSAEEPRTPEAMEAFAKSLSESIASGQSELAPARGSGAEIVGAIANKFGCTIEQAERKITATMDILQLDRETAVVFLREVRHYGLKPPNRGISTNSV